MSDEAPKPKTLEWTDAQKTALAFPANCLVNAAAGSGKTRTAVELFVRLLMGQSDADGESVRLEPSQLAAITFTNAAAGEMKERIALRLEALLEDPTTDSERIGHLLQRFHHLQISTIHSFCLRILRSHPLEAGFDPDAKLVDENRLYDWMEEILKPRVLEDFERDPAVADFLTAYGGIGSNGPHQKGLLRELAVVYNAIRQTGLAPQAYRSVTLDAKGERLTLGEVYPKFRNAAQRVIPALASKKTKTADAVADVLDGWEARYQQAYERRDWPAIAEMMNDIRFTAGEKKKVKPSSGLPADSGVEEMVETSDQLMGLAWEAAVEPVVQRMFGWLERLEEAYEHRKRTEKVYDNLDLLIKARNLLRDHPAVLRRWRATYEVVFVDEFQDTDPVQIDLLKLLFFDSPTADAASLRPRKAFLVGDPQQAIYGFKGASFTTYMEFRHDWEALGEPNGRISLDFPENRRSHPMIVEFVNRFTEKAREYYRQLEALPPLDESEGSVEPMRAGKTSEDRSPHATWITPLGWEPGSSAPREWEPEAAATKIAELIDQHGVAPKEIAVLFRTKSRLADYQDALARRGVPISLSKGVGFYQQTEIVDGFNAWASFLRPNDRLSVAALLRSPMVGVDDPTLFRICGAMHKGDPNYLAEDAWTDPANREAILKLATDRSREAMARFLEWSEALWGKVGEISLEEILSFALEASDYRAILLTGPMGPQRLANLDKLLEVASAFEAEGGSPTEWPWELERRIAEEKKERLAALPETGAGSVTLSTVHGAKGLEWEHVFLVGMKTKGKNDSGKIRFSPRFGLGAEAPDREGKWHSTYRRNLAEKDAAARDAAESLRLLYVALTRAKSHLYLSGPLDGKNEQTSPSWLGALIAHGESLAEAGALERVEVAGDPQRASDPAERWPTPEEALGKIAIVSDPEPEPIPPLDEEALARRETPLSTTFLSRLLFCPRFAWHNLNPREERETEEEESGAIARPPDPDPSRESRGDPFGPAESGNIVHFMLETADAAETDPQRRSDSMVRRAAARLGFAVGSLTSDERESLDRLAQTAARWWESNAAGWREAGLAIHREWPFLIQTDSGGHRFLIRGVIDLWTEREGRPLHLIDFKSGRKTHLGGALYAQQMGVYGWALERMVGARPESANLEYLKEGISEDVLPVLDEAIGALDDSNGWGESVLAILGSDETDAPPELDGLEYNQCARHRCPFIDRCHPGKTPC